MKLESVMIDTIHEYANALQNDPALRVETNAILAEVSDPYVPYQTGQLAGNITITAEGVTYNQPYATNQYFAPTHSKQKHPLATSEWDLVAFNNHQDEIYARVQQLLEDKLKEL